MRFLIYMRVSTEKQEISGLGLEAQRHACLEWIKKQTNQGEILEYTDIVTGTDRKRKELQERIQLVSALSEIKSGDVLLVAKRDRLGRDSYVNAMIERMIEKKKAFLFCANGEMDGEAPHDILMRRMLDAFAEYEGLMASVRTTLAIARKKAKGERHGHIPYGYYLVSKGLLAVNPEEMNILKEMYQLRMIKGYAFRRVAKEMNAMGYKNRPTKKDPEGAPWNHGSTSRLYSNWDSSWDGLESSVSFLDHKRNQECIPVLT